MREVTSHKLNGLNDALKISVMDELGSGGANHIYEIASTAPALTGLPAISPQTIFFQNGPIAESGVNGISGEALVAIVIDRLQCFQKGQYSCRENAIALTKLEEAMHWLKHRTESRMQRGVEGTSQK